MNEREKRMVDILKDLRENHHVIGVKAEFEAEGTRLEEALRLKEVVTKAGLELTIKIGGCEAFKDMYDARSIGVNRIVAPMIESAYALRKYLQMTKRVFADAERKEVSFFVNIETKQGNENFQEMLNVPEFKDLDGVVLGRVDLTGSLGLNRDDINTDAVLNIARNLFTTAKRAGLTCAIGGGVAKESLPFFRALPNGCLDYYETRKVLFKCPEATANEAEKGILKAVGFELMWLKNKREFYGAIFEEDVQRIKMLESRYDRLINEAGGKID
jgi:4-hydroxy-2-oxoheptanedioate aldolase